MKKNKKTVYYSDELNEDFALSRDKIGSDTVDGEYKYARDGSLYRIGSFILYRLVATPVAWLYCRLWLGLRIKGKKNLKSLKNGYFIYGNHTQNIADAFIPTLVTFPRKCNIVTGAETVSIRGLRTVVGMLGAVPIGTTFGAKKNFYRDLKLRISQKQAVAIYPEAHIWPYYNDIRAFPDSSFAYPEKLSVPCVGYTVVYRQRRVFKNLHPCATVYIGEPVYPSNDVGRAELRDEIYGFMKKTVKDKESYEYIAYRKKTEN